MNDLTISKDVFAIGFILLLVLGGCLGFYIGHNTVKADYYVCVWQAKSYDPVTKQVVPLNNQAQCYPSVNGTAPTVCENETLNYLGTGIH